MNWYKRYIYSAGGYQPMSVRSLIKKLSMLGIYEVKTDKGSSHKRFYNPHNKTTSEFPCQHKDVRGDTIKAYVVNAFDLGNVWKILGARPNRQDVLDVQHLLPWNIEKAVKEKEKEKEKEEAQRKRDEELANQPWNLMGDDILDEAEQKRLKDEEETKEIERMIAEDDAAEAARKAQKSIKPEFMPSIGGVKMNWYKKTKKVPGGLADKKKPSDFNKKQLDMGVEVEMEHTNDRDLSKDISMDHLEEFPAYYTELDRMEEKLEKTKPATARRGRYDGGLQRINLH